MKLIRIEKEAWKSLSESAHILCFNARRSAHSERIDYALLGVNSADHPIGYLTVREIDESTAYWQFGGAFDGIRGTVRTFSLYKLFVDYAKTHYKRVTTLIENNNTAMLKMAMKVGFRIIGIRTFKNDVLLEHLLEFENAV